MGLTATITTPPFYVGKHKKCLGTLAFDNSYGTGGEDYATTLGNDVLELTIPPYAGYTFAVDYTNKKVLAYVPISVAGGAAAASTDALSIKSGGVDKESATARHSASQQVPSTTDLSTALAAVPFTALLRV